MMGTFKNILVSTFPEKSESYLVVAATEKLPEPCFFPCGLGKIFLIGAVKIGLEAQVLLYDLYHVDVRAQGPHFHDTGEALQ